MAVKPGYAWYAGTLRDGRITTQLPMIKTAWQTILDDSGTLSGTLVLADPKVAALNPYLTAEPCRCFLAVAYLDEEGTETFLQAGPVWTHNYAWASRQLTIGAGGLWSYYDHRKVLPVLDPGVNPASATTDYTSSLGTIAKSLVQLAHTHTAGELPVVFPDDEAGTVERSYPGYEMDSVGDMLRNLTQVDGGPEIQFVPRRRADDARYIEWVMRIGTTAVPLLAQPGDAWVWDASVPRSSISDLDIARDGSSLATRQWVQGAGSETATLFAEKDSAELTDAGFPLLEASDASNHTTVIDQATLDGWATAEQTAAARPQETWSPKVRRDDTPKVSAYLPGDSVRFDLVDDPYIGTVSFQGRLTGIAGDDSSDVTLTLQPTLGGV